jgi:hypothetical protein
MDGVSTYEYRPAYVPRTHSYIPVQVVATVLRTCTLQGK